MTKTQQVIPALQQFLANTHILFVNTQSVHWHATGPSFYSVHKLTEEQYQTLAENLDEIAERIRMLGAQAPASLSMYIKLGTLPEMPNTMAPEDMLKNLLNCHQQIITDIRDILALAEEEHDVTTADLLSGILPFHEKVIWMLKATIG